MKYIYAILLFIIWSIASSWWYVCKIKCLCATTAREESAKIYNATGDTALVDLIESIMIKKNSAVPLISGNSTTIVDSILLVLSRNPSKEVMIKSLVSIDEMKENPKLGLARAQYIKKLIEPKLQDTLNVNISQEVSENIYKNDVSYSAIKFILQDRQEVRTSDSTQADSPTPTIEKTASPQDYKNTTVQEISTPNQSVPTSTSSSNDLKQNTDKHFEEVESNTSALIYQNYVSIRTYGKYDLEMNDEVANMVKQVQETFIAYPNAKVKVIGHTCEISGAKFNYGLGLRRANTFRDLLVDSGIPSSQIKAISKGLTQPLVPNISDENREVNRRIEVIITK